MGRINSIRKKIAFLLLVLFALSATPKVLFHEVLAGHKDSLVCTDTDKSAPHFHQPAFHCAFDDLVVSSPFLSAEWKGTPEPPVFIQQTSSGFLSGVLSSTLLHKESRGPPVI